MIEKLSKIFEASAIFSILLGTFLIMLTVIGREIFSINKIYLQEFALMCLGVSFAFSAFSVTVNNLHVRLDALANNFSFRLKKSFEYLGGIFTFCWCAMMVYSAIGFHNSFVLLSWKFKESSNNPSGIEGVFIYKSFILIMIFGYLIGEIIRLYRLKSKPNSSK